MVGPLYTGLSGVAMPGEPALAAFDTQPTSENWSITFSPETSAVNSSVNAVIPGPESWSITFDDSHFGEILDIPSWFTDLTLAGMVGAPDALSAKPAFPQNVSGTSDTWFITWTETPVDTVQLDLWDVWSLSFVEVSLVTLSQTFPATENWSITFTETSQLSVSSASNNLALNDLWNLQWNDASSMFEQNATTETWSITYSQEQSALLSTQASSVDTWSITWTDVSSIVTAGAFDVETIDTWSLQFVEASSVQQNLFSGTADIWSITLGEVSGLTTFSDVELSEPWFIAWNDVSDVRATPMFSDLADTWALSYQSEISAVSNIPTIPLISFDQWSITFSTESGAILSTLIGVPIGRLIKIGGTKRKVIKVE